MGHFYHNNSFQWPFSSLEVCCYGIWHRPWHQLVSTNQRTVSGQMWTNESGPLWCPLLLVGGGQVVKSHLSYFPTGSPCGWPEVPVFAI